MQGYITSECRARTLTRKKNRSSEPHFKILSCQSLEVTWLMPREVSGLLVAGKDVISSGTSDHIVLLSLRLARWRLLLGQSGSPEHTVPRQRILGADLSPASVPAILLRPAPCQSRRKRKKTRSSSHEKWRRVSSVDISSPYSPSRVDAAREERPAVWEAVALSVGFLHFLGCSTS